MKFKLLYIIPLFYLFILSAGCRKNYVSAEDQTVLFQYEYINYAWGVHHHGFFIDGEGNILIYNNPGEWHFPGAELSISDIRLEENLSKCITSGMKITQEDLDKYSKYIEYIASSKVTAIKNTGADRGSTRFICYQHDEGSESYKGHIIKMEGDFSCENLNFYSKRVTSWMRSISNSLPLE